MDENLKLIAEKIWQLGEASILQNGSMQMTYFLIDGEDVINILPPIPPDMINDDIAKSAIGYTITCIARELSAKMVCVLSEAWTIEREGDIGEYRKGKEYYKPPSECDDRKEILMLICKQPGGRTEVKSGQIIRDPNDSDLAGVAHSSWKDYGNIETRLIGDWAQ